MLKVLARPKVGVCVPLAFCLCHGNGLFPRYFVLRLCLKAELSAMLINNIKMSFSSK